MQISRRYGHVKVAINQVVDSPWCFLRRSRAATTTHARLTGTTTAFCHHSLDRSIYLRRPPSSRRRLHTLYFPCLCWRDGEGDGEEERTGRLAYICGEDQGYIATYPCWLVYTLPRAASQAPIPNTTPRGP